MIDYAVVNSITKERVGTLHCDVEKDLFTMDIAQGVDLWSMSLIMQYKVKKGSYFMNHEDCRHWIDERIIPAGRHNISQILHDNGISEWTRYNMLMLSMGHSPQDEIIIEPLV